MIESDSHNNNNNNKNNINSRRSREVQFFSMTSLKICTLNRFNLSLGLIKSNFHKASLGNVSFLFVFASR